MKTIADIRPGVLYSVATVAGLFSKSKTWVVKKIAAKKLAAGRLDNGSTWLITGEAIIEMYNAASGEPEVQEPRKPNKVNVKKAFQQLKTMKAA
jgi:hypothetical protein